MFYVKEKISEAAELHIEIHDENVYGRCPRCGSEVQVDLAAVLGDGEGDLFGTSVLCESCSKKIKGGIGHGDQQI